MYGSNFCSWTRNPRETSRRADRSGGDSLTESRDHSASDEDEPRVSLLRASFLPSESSQRSGGTESIVAEIDRISP